MSSEIKKEIELEIAHVLFIDIVGYSKLLIDEQRDYLHTLNEVVRETDSFRAAEVAGKLTRLPTGDYGHSRSRNSRLRMASRFFRGSNAMN